MKGDTLEFLDKKLSSQNTTVAVICGHTLHYNHP